MRQLNMWRCDRGIIQVNIKCMLYMCTYLYVAPPQPAVWYTLLEAVRHFRSVVTDTGSRGTTAHDFNRHQQTCIFQIYAKTVLKIVMRRLYRHEWNWLWNGLCVNQHPWQRTRDHGVCRFYSNSVLGWGWGWGCWADARTANIKHWPFVWVLTIFECSENISFCQLYWHTLY